ncbi:MAG: methylated-DNA--[protein]-cysteine S-methyltransferase [Actinomycetota bacterium]
MLDTFLYRSPIGPLDISINESGAVVGIRFEGKSRNELPQRHALSRAFDDYFAGGKGLNNLPVSSSAGPFQTTVLDFIRTIPRGEVRTYAEVATAVGSPGAARAVGNTMSSNHVPIIVPCHRVVASNGLGGYSGGLDKKEFLLELERRSAGSMAPT